MAIAHYLPVRSNWSDETWIHRSLISLRGNGVHLLENLKLDELVAKNVQEFAFIMTALKIRGATGSTVSPIAVH